MSAFDKAVDLAAEMLRQGKTLPHAVNAAAKTYNIERAEVRSGLSQRSGRSQRGKARPAARVHTLDNDALNALGREVDGLLADSNAQFEPRDRARLQRIQKRLREKQGMSRRDAATVRHLAAVATLGYGYDR